MLLPGGKVFVTHGSMDAPDFLDKIAYATQDRAAYLPAAPTIPRVTMYGQININRKGEYPKKSHRLPAGPAPGPSLRGYRMCQRRPPSPPIPRSRDTGTHDCKVLRR